MCQIWKSKWKAAQDPKVRKVYMLGKIARTRRQRLVGESIEDAVERWFNNRWTWLFFLERQHHLYRGYDSDFDPDATFDDVFTRSKPKKSSTTVIDMMREND